MATSDLTKIMGRMNDLEHQVIETDLMAHIYGPIGVGKTTLAVYAAQMIKGDGEILYLDSSDGWVSLRNTPELMEGVTRIPVEDSKDLPVISEALRLQKPGFEKFTVLIIDEGSSLANDALEKVVRMDTGTAADAELPEIEGKHYGTQLSIFTSIIKKFHRIEGLHVILVSHDADKSVKGKVEKIHPQYPPKLRKEIQKLMHVCGYVSAELLNNGEYNRKVQSLPSMLIEAKSRIGALPVKTDFETFVNVLYDWLYEGGMAEDLVLPETETVLGTDVLTDEPGTGDDDVSMNDSDDEPVIAED